MDPNYLVTLSLNEVFRDKDTGKPLSNGYLLFKRDNARTEDKPVYTLDGTPTNYTYTSLGSRIDLYGDGTPGYLYTNIPIYYYPFDDSGNTDLYYVEVYNSNDVLQFTRQAWPNYIPESSYVTQSDYENFIPNGQFKNHINVPGNSTTPGLVTSAETIIAYGGWRFLRPANSSSVDVISFDRFGSYTINPEDSPRYAFRLKNENPGNGDTYKDLRIRFYDVNKFQSPPAQNWTLGCSGISNGSSPVTIQILVIKNFGTNGDSQTELPIGSVTFGTSYSDSEIIINFGDNIGKIIGQLDDDYVEIAFRYPLNSGFDASITNICLLMGNIDSYIFPPETDKQFDYRSITPRRPNYDGSDLQLNTILTKEGFEYDKSNVGDFSPSARTLKPGWLLCDGSQYKTSDTSPEGIPYSRLQSILWDPNANAGAPTFGTGKNFSTAFSIATGELLLFNNAVGGVPNTADGTVPTGFTFTNVCTGLEHYCDAYPQNSATFYLRNKYPGAVVWPDSANGFSIVPASDNTLDIPSSINISTSIRRSAYYYICPAASGLASKWVKFHTFNNIQVNNYLWFTVDGAGTDPAISGYTGYPVALKSTYSANTLASICAAAMTGVQITDIKTVAANLITPGSYFNFNSNINSYYVYYLVDGAGTDPAPSGRIGISVAISSTDTADMVKTKTIIAINQTYFAVPDLRGQVLKGISASTTTRFNTNWVGSSSGIGTMEPDGILSHHHSSSYIPVGTIGGGVNVTGASTYTPYQYTNFTGDPETRVFNIAVNFFIKY